ncbi:hypothetical protein NXG27_06830 [Megasphaera paucivorans]|uniref:SLH domain-containing protein n=1 Tax=Megasphaera paucivorans TaxID=349095 RepID=A0A1G9Z616_9FIRM|nr:hypothetical protein [Megasphaera paucivorans]SDN16988.1 hypothetical protein SAMN05660299_02247 [Megasphaera paucivorans]
MKRKLMIFVSLMMMMAGSVMAYNPYAPNPFDTMERTSWEYKAVYDLTKAGLTGSDMSKFSPAYSLTRYEMAQMVAVAIQNRQKATAGQKEEIDKLQDSFSEDLAYAAGGNSTASHNTQPAGQIFDWRQGIKTK